MEMVSETSQEPFEVGVGMRSPWISQLVPHDRLRLRSLAGAFLFEVIPCQNGSYLEIQEVNYSLNVPF